ncbi:OTU-like cysteine protease [Nitzschia inconspicua]|uniref:OTU-like cysteine protease n=1 Tax=Nitzschia inconspicua TaxID=303405 RepID=A0A9K3LK03_9STRA|nr:OTU-like cysteine protease [Nitzschia inconspicua]
MSSSSSNNSNNNTNNTSSKEELDVSYKKALKSLEGEKRAAIKKAKALKGKKGKDALAAVESEYEEKMKRIVDEYQTNLAAIITTMEESLSVQQQQQQQNDDDTPESVFTMEATTTTTTTTTEVAAKAAVASTNIVVVDPSNGETETDNKDAEVEARERKLAKARKKKERQREKEREQQEQIERETANAGPSMRHVELEQIQTILSPLNLKVSEVEADGHCLYRAVGAQTDKSYTEIRSLCADALQANKDELAAFCELTDDVGSFDEYVDMVRNSAEWGGHVELRAISMALDRPIHVYSVQQGKSPLIVHEEGTQSPILLSYHLHYYALGEHYNQVIATEA